MGRARGPAAPTARPTRRRREKRTDTERQWTPELIREELLAFAEAIGQQPSEADFRTYGQQALASAMSYHGGRKRYRLLIAHLPAPTHQTVPRQPGRPKGSGHWTEETIRTELEAYTAKMTSFPTSDRFDRDNRGDLRSAVSRTGGMSRWAEELGLPLGHRQDRGAYTEADAIRDAQELIRLCGWVPGKTKARQLGYGRFATYLALDFQGGSRAFVARYADQLGVRPATKAYAEEVARRQRARRASSSRNRP